MPVITPAIGVQSGSHSALSFRQLASAIVGIDVTTFVNSVSAVSPGHGLSRPGDLAVTQNGTPNMSVNVSKGSALITGSSVLAQGVYAVTNDAVVMEAITKVAMLETDVNQVRGEVKSIMTHLLNKPRMSGSYTK